MPLIKGKSEKAFEHNLKTEMHEGKPQKQSLAIAYAMKRKAKKKMAMGGYAEGGEAKGVHREAGKFAVKGPGEKGTEGQSMAGSAARMGHSWANQEHRRVLNELKSMKKPDLMAEGGFIGSHQSSEIPCDDGDLEPMAHMEAEKHSGYVEHEKGGDHFEYPHESLNQMGNESEGAGDMDEVDPVIKRIMMGRAAGYSEGGKVANSDEIEAGFAPNEFDDLHLRDDLESHYGIDGDEHGNEREDEDRRDIVARIMKSRRLKDRLPEVR